MHLLKEEGFPLASNGRQSQRYLRRQKDSALLLAWRWTGSCEKKCGWSPGAMRNPSDSKETGSSVLQSQGTKFCQLEWAGCRFFPEPPNKSQPSKYLDFSLMKL